MSESSNHEPELGALENGQILVAVGLDFTFTDILASHAESFKTLDQWLTGIRTYSLEDAFETDAVLWDELEDCGYEIGEGEVEDGDKILKIYDVWVPAEGLPEALKNIEALIADLKAQAIQLLPPGLHAATQNLKEPAQIIELLAKTSEPE